MTPYEKGEEAYFHGLTFGDNPYPKYSKEWVEWNKAMSNRGDPGL